ncbi:hypothetical protein E2C01_070913 [Portunus trituberculatus]|uniref:Uncharacterized protein n=1 Tax=Portunus trituberculatus TaxID=210409 RepID=A0A5B7I4V7_PORTR|nr:hypothetical protein [Portunus trituberculatus]
MAHPDIPQPRASSYPPLPVRAALRWPLYTSLPLSLVHSQLIPFYVENVGSGKSSGYWESM